MKRGAMARRRYSKPKHWKHLYWIIPLLVADVFLFRWLLKRPDRVPPAEAFEESMIIPKRPSPFERMAFPTAQDRLLDPEAAGVFQPTASGNPVSALYGSTRTAERGGSLMPTFHEGIDIAAMRRDHRGRPLDEIRAVADGRIAYINRHAGNSNYGIYVVLEHEEPALGNVFTLYAHLDRLEHGLRVGQPVNAGQVLGIMGNTSSSPIPMVRAHLHLEVGTILNARFDVWYRANKLKPNHGNYHGWNLFGVDPLPVFAQSRSEPEFNFREHLRRITPAFEVVFRSSQQPDYFNRYPALWEDGAYAGRAVAVAVSEGGVPLRGRNATEEEVGLLGRHPAAVTHVDESVLGRNGARLITRAGGQWKLAKQGERWLELITY